MKRAPRVEPVSLFGLDDLRGRLVTSRYIAEIADITPLILNCLVEGDPRSLPSSRRPSMKKLTFVVVSALVVLSFGCKKGAGSSSGAAMAKMTEFKDEMCKCKDAKCAQDVSDKMTKWSQEQSKNQKEPPKMSEADTKKAAEIGEALGKCMQTAMGAAPPVPEGSAAPAGSADPAAAGALPKKCDDYKAQVEKLKTCEKIRAKAKDALVNAYNDAAAGWATMPDGAKAGLNTSCKAGTEAVIAAAKDACGW